MRNGIVTQHLFTWGPIRSFLDECMDDPSVPEKERQVLDQCLRYNHEHRFAQNHLSIRRYGAGIVSNIVFEREQAIITTYLYLLTGLDGTLGDLEGCFFKARIFMTPKGFFTTHYKAGVRTVASKLGSGGIECASVVSLRVDLGLGIFNAMLTSCGYPTSRDVPSPFDCDIEEVTPCGCCTVQV